MAERLEKTGRRGEDLENGREWMELEDCGRMRENWES